MPIHGWTRVDAGIFHHFQHQWISALSGALNAGLLPADSYALAEQHGGGLAHDALLSHHPAASHVISDESAQYATRAKAVVIRHSSNHRVVAVVKIISPGNKNSRHGIRSFVTKALELLQGGIHLPVVDLFAPAARDPDGLHKLIWDEIIDNDFSLPQTGRCP